MKKYRKRSPFNRNLKHILSHAQFKQIIFTVVAALCIGFILGYIVLQMVNEESPQQATDMEATHVKTAAGEEQVELPELSLYVLQGGVFSEAENATDYAKSLTAKDIAFVVREAKDQHYVWMNPSHSEEEAKQLAGKMDKQGITTYVKNWELPAKTIKLEDSDAAWLQRYQTLLAASLEGNTVDVDEWQALLEQELMEQGDAWQKGLKDIMKKEAASDEQLLLHIIAHYEKIIKD